MRPKAIQEQVLALNDFPHFVARPSEVWNTRAPLFQFVQLHKKENEIYFTLLLSINKLLLECRGDSPPDSVKKWLVGGRVSARAWKSYKRSIRDKHDLERPLEINELEKSLGRTLPAVTEYAITSYCGLFESFMQCWALNYLLAKLETVGRWTDKERKLAIFFHPWFHEGTLPTFLDIRDELPVVQEELSRLPHIISHPETGDAVQTPISRELNAYKTILFWRDWRNLLVHYSGVASSRFYNKYKAFWEEFKKLYPYIPDFKERRQLSLRDDTFRALTTVHYNAAKKLKHVLVELSHGRRGHVLAPGQPTKGEVPPHKIPPNPPQMVMAGDHELSVSWMQNQQYRDQMLDMLIKNNVGNEYLVRSAIAALKTLDVNTLDGYWTFWDKVSAIRTFLKKDIAIGPRARAEFQQSLNALCDKVEMMEKMAEAVGG